MFSFIIFVVSGIAIILILTGKLYEMRKEQPVWFLKAISKGDERYRDISHKATHAYSEYKEKSLIYVKKQLPLKLKNTSNKIEGVIRDKFEEYFGGIRNTKMLGQKGNEGLSEFFKNMKNMEEETAEAIKDMDEAEREALESGEEKR